MNRGYITLMSVLVLGAIGVAIATSLLLMGIDSSRASFIEVQSGQAKGLADACAEEGLEQVRLASGYTGTGGLTLGQGTCVYTVTSQGGQNRIITASGTVGTIIRKVKIILTSITPLLTISSWQEVAE
ncbi:MAG TPA: hypothetical protein VM103_01965 [Candidatus Paceibacterota bacterium]|nr:hypothetical protein [Candidatus Paceibacterota bacterium]